jgi:hypothetical protein
MARHAAEARETTHEALAVYQTMGRVDYAASPELQAVTRARSDGHHMIVAEDSAQAARIRAHLEADQAGRAASAQEAGEQAHAPPPPVQVIEAAQLYQARSQGRQQWRGADTA